MVVLIDRADLTLATGAQTADADGTALHTLPAVGHLIAAEVSIPANQGPVYAVLSVGRTSLGMTLASGWVRGPVPFSHGGGVWWHGRFNLHRPGADILMAHVRNDSGATVSLVVEWAVEAPEPHSSHEDEEPPLVEAV